MSGIQWTFGSARRIHRRPNGFAILALVALVLVFGAAPAPAAASPYPRYDSVTGCKTCQVSDNLIGLAPDDLRAQLEHPALVSPSPVPVLAYYYIWFDPGSWNRAKIDYPLLGRYSSSDEAIIRQHIRWAKAAGIQGFIVSWKSTPVLNDRLDKLIAISEQEHFKLAMIYQGLDFNRDPLPIDQVYADLGEFVSRYASSPVLHIFGKPLMLWSGTWEYSRSDIARVSQAYRDRLLLLATEKNVADYARIADLVDGDAYYWSSVNPETNNGYETKLNAMAEAVHRQQGLWIAPAAPGFDARLIGGTTVVDRRNGDTFVEQMSAAAQSSPDAIGIISWNEFSENTYIEPSEKLGDRYLQIVASIQKTDPPNIPDFDSSEPGGADRSIGISRIIAIGGMVGIVVGSVGVLLRRNRGRR